MVVSFKMGAESTTIFYITKFVCIFITTTADKAVDSTFAWRRITNESRAPWRMVTTRLDCAKGPAKRAFLPCDAMLARYNVMIPCDVSVCLILSVGPTVWSVCLSVTNRCFIKTAKQRLSKLCPRQHTDSDSSKDDITPVSSLVTIDHNEQTKIYRIMEQ